MFPLIFHSAFASMVLAAIIGALVAAPAPVALPQSRPPEGHLSVGPHLLATDEDTHDELAVNVAQGDRQAVSALLNQGRVSRVDGRVSVDILESDFGATKIRITDGRDEGSEGWLPAAEVVP